MFRNIDGAKAYRSYKCCADHPQARALRAVQRRLLQATDRYITAKVVHAGHNPNIGALRQLSAIYALVALKRDLQGER